jgi:hypothetical protein
MQTNLGRRITAYQTFQRVFTNFVPAILLYQPMYVYAVSDKINGVTDKINLSTTSDRFITIGNWFVKTKLARKGSAS